jgi:hypothetical protein
MDSMIVGIRGLLIAALFTMSAAAQAVGYTGPFVINQLYISGAENYHLRVSGFPAISACSNGPTWAYVNQSQSGSKTYIAALMTAYAMGKTVNIVWQPDTSGYCQVLEVIVSQ